MGPRVWALRGGGPWFPAIAQPISAAVRGQVLRVHHVGPGATLVAVRALPALLLGVEMAASFTMGANDVANATGPAIIAYLFSLQLAGLVGGAAIAVGALTWGRRILETVAFDVVTMDLSMASAAQGVQALVVLAAVSQGSFTSMNQALIGAMAGAGLARGRETVHRAQIVGILRGWLIGPLSGFSLALLAEAVIRTLGAS